VFVEFALTFSLILLLLTGVFDYGASIHEARTMLFAARDGARESSRHYQINLDQETFDSLDSAAQATRWNAAYVQAMNLTLDALESTGYTKTNYEVSVKSEDYTMPNQGTTASLIRVSVRRKSTSKGFDFRKDLTFRPCATVTFKLEKTVNIGQRASGVDFSCS
jgi:Flp pilus assembly protein TadG